jgi:Resolvase, N terminal domain
MNSPDPARPAGDMPASFGTTKIRPAHLERQALVYVRQSTLHQVLENRESTARQYALVERAVALGWARGQVEVIDEDQGQSGQSAVARLGFQRLLTAVALDQVGIIFGLEMSRLARSNKDWHQLLEVCAVFGTLLADQEGIYDPTSHNDQLLLGLKGTPAGPWSGARTRLMATGKTNDPLAETCEARFEDGWGRGREVQPIIL